MDWPLGNCIMEPFCYISSVFFQVVNGRKMQLLDAQDKDLLIILLPAYEKVPIAPSNHHKPSYHCNELLYLLDQDILYFKMAGNMVICPEMAFHDTQPCWPDKCQCGAAFKLFTKLQVTELSKTVSKHENKESRHIYIISKAPIGVYITDESLWVIPHFISWVLLGWLSMWSLFYKFLNIHELHIISLEAQSQFIPSNFHMNYISINCCWL